MSRFIHVATKTGFMQVTLNEEVGALLVSFRTSIDEPKALRQVQIAVRNTKVVYDEGWRLDTLLWLLDTYQPTPLMWLKASEQVSRSNE